MNRHLLVASAAAALCLPALAFAAASDTAPPAASSPAAGAPTDAPPATTATTPTPAAPSAAPDTATANAPPAAAAPQQLAAHGDIASTLQASGQFTILDKALAATNLTAVLKGSGPLTVIAPTDAAFQSLPAGELDNLMKPENVQQLQSLLTYHVINAAVPLTKIEGSRGPVQTVNGAKVVIDGSATPIKFNDADVTATSTTSNGSIYVVDKVLSPDKLAAEAPPPATPGQPAAAQVASTAPPSGAVQVASTAPPSGAVNDPGAQVASAQPASAQPVNAPSASDAGAPVSATTPADASAPTATDQTASGPVPDTPQNRAQYGQPLSRAGRASQAAGN